MDLCLFSQLTSSHRLSFLPILDFLLRTALESVEQTSEILQMELLVSGSPQVDRRSLNSTFASTAKPRWLESDVVWFGIVSLPSLFSGDDVLHHLCQWIIADDDKWREFYLHPQLNSLPRWQDRPVSSLDQLLIIRLLRPDRLLDALADYLVDLVQRGGRYVRQIDCRLDQLAKDRETTTKRSELIVWKNLSRASPIKEWIRE